MTVSTTRSPRLRVLILVGLAFWPVLRHTKRMESKTLLRACYIGAAAMAYIGLLIFRFDILSIYTIFFAVIGAGVGVVVAHKVRFG